VNRSSVGRGGRGEGAPGGHENLFERANRPEIEKAAPLPVRMRPRDFDEFVGQEHIVGPGTLLRQAIENDAVPSCIFAGPAGSGKTTLARLVARRTKAEFVQLSAVTSGVAEVRRLIEEARHRLTHYGRRTVVFIDEIHRFNKAQQDALLPAVENGTVTLIGATTENPYHTVNSALVSRCRVYKLEPLNEEHIETLIRRALEDEERGLGTMKVHITPDALEHLVRVADGDARSALSALEMAARATPPADGRRVIDLGTVIQAVQRRALTYDRAGDAHYDTISAFIKSMRGSDPDAALYWLARMVYGGEDPRFIARRIVICAAEDVGNADPRALMVATAAAEAVELVGWPEGRIPLAQAAVYVATAPKSNAVYRAIEAALDDVKSRAGGQVPMHLRSTSYPDDRRGPGAKKDYIYPHDHPGHHVDQQYLPEGWARGRYYRPSGNGFEGPLKDRLMRWWPELRRAWGLGDTGLAGRSGDGPHPAGRNAAESEPIRAKKESAERDSKA